MFHDEDSDAANVAFRDLMMAAFGLVLMLVALLILRPIIEEQADKKSSINPIGNVNVEMFWPNNLAIDVDLWVKGPNDRPVGYSNKNGVLFDLLRDDLGSKYDSTPHNFEISISRGLSEGEYIVNLHWFSNTEGRAEKLPVDVAVTVAKDKAGKTPPVEIFKKQVFLAAVGEEITVVRFKLDKDFNLVPGSINFEPIPLRSNKELQ